MTFDANNATKRDKKIYIFALREGVVNKHPSLDVFETFTHKGKGVYSADYK